MKSFLKKLRPASLYALFSDELNQDRIFGLDLLRFFAITTVVIGHGANLLPQKIADFQKYITFDGVSIFFVLSGFLIGGILIKQLENNKASFSLLLDFWIRRWFRTLPAYFLILIVVTIGYKISDPSFTFEDIGKYYIFCQNLFYQAPPYFRESWSLCVEEWFYFTIPLLIFALITVLKLSPKISVITISLSVIFLVTFLKYQIYMDYGENSELYFYHQQVIYRIDNIIYGVLGAYVSYYYSKIWNSIPLLLFITGIGIIIIEKAIEVTGYHSESFAVFYYYMLAHTIISISTVLLLPFLSNFRKIKYKIGNLITIISLISYSMYLTHESLIRILIIKNIPWTDFTKNYNIILPTIYLLYWTLTLTLSVLIYKYYEVPTTRLREIFTGKKSRILNDK
ncbi:hypothetical protein ASG31_15970 [Chryseobacterium sp. Leaf404]|uniref:acyltransferase family protein n=1 Tax=unclassified Chryseobacterium TaxID=2593645 RepID=UPI0006F9AF31|nr:MULTISPECIES: acyltransferase [unclassified Chryseobacterium]KQT15097.1 hypothetical protein ASG31_15970 [Chryseobacterium sp. Leaf404]